MLTRRDFLKLCGTNLAALALPRKLFREGGSAIYRPKNWPNCRLEDLPSRLVQILDRVPSTQLGADGLLYLLDKAGNPSGPVPLRPTQWNQENNLPVDRLDTSKPWGIVLHWYGDKENFDKSICGYLRGFNALRDVGGYITRTSAHFLISDGDTLLEVDDTRESSGILQTQAPDSNGIPRVASHLLPLDYLGHKQKKQYFVRALYQLEYEGRSVHTLLQDLFDGPVVDPNNYTVAIEIAGYNFEEREHYPEDQKIANVVSVVWSLMKRYGILAVNLLGHHEIQLGKADPGKKFMALIRLLVGLKALIEDGERMKYLVFGPFLDFQENTEQAVSRYFDFVYYYLQLVSSRRRVFEWETESKYWFVNDCLFAKDRSQPIVDEFTWPVDELPISLGYTFLSPGTHEGLDFFSVKKLARLANSRLAAAGECIFIGESRGHCHGKMASFRHRLMDGAEVVTIYSHLDHLGNLRVGEKYPASYPLGIPGRDREYSEPFLHFAIAYKGTWDLDLSSDPTKPLNAGSSWIQERYIDPIQVLNVRLSGGNVNSAGVLNNYHHTHQSELP